MAVLRTLLKYLKGLFIWKRCSFCGRKYPAFLVREGSIEHHTGWDEEGNDLYYEVYYNECIFCRRRAK